MLLYVYTLNERDGVTCKPVEVKETKVYYTVKDRCDYICFYHARLPKEQIKEVEYDPHLGYSVALTEKNHNLAKELLTSKINKQKAGLKKQMELLDQKKVNIILGFACLDLPTGGTN